MSDIRGYDANYVAELEVDCKDKQRLIETQKQYLDNKDLVIKGFNEMITILAGDLEVMRLQRDATQSSRCPNCERLRALLKSSPEPATINPETMQPGHRAELYRNPVPKDRAYAEWREQALKGG